MIHASIIVQVAGSGNGRGIHDADIVQKELAKTVSEGQDPVRKRTMLRSRYRNTRCSPGRPHLTGLRAKSTEGSGELI